MDTTNRLGLPYLAAAQSQKHVTLNESLRALDALVQVGVVAADAAAPPAVPSEGDRYIVGEAPTGAFAGKRGQLAAFDDGAWRFTAPRAGWIAFTVAGDRLLLFDGAAWRDVATVIRRLGDLTGLGIGTQPDSTNAFSASLNAALFAARAPADGGTGDVRVTLNRTATGRTASFLFQNAWSGRAELGLAGDDLLRIRTSADGNLWNDALTADPVTGSVKLPGGIAACGGQAMAAFRNHVVNGDFQVAQRGEGPFAVSVGGSYGFDLWRGALTGAGSGALTRTAFAPGQAAVPGGRFYATLTATIAASNSSADLQTRLEDVARLAGLRVTLSCSYRTSAAVAVQAVQVFGTGGSASVTIPILALTAAAGWTRRSATFVMPAVAGQTVGVGSYTALRFVLPGGNSAGVSFDLADVQLEEGPVVTAFERRPPAVETMLARRFLRRSATVQQAGDLAPDMRASPVQSGAAPAFFYSAEL
jgi:hypothetical protein